MLTIRKDFYFHAWRPGVLDRYVVREIAIPIGLSLLLVISTLIIARLLALVGLILNQGVSVATVLALTVHILPSLLAMSLPMAVLLGTLLGIGRLGSDSELVAVAACGLSIRRVAVPVMLLAAVLYTLAMLFALRVVPAANASVRLELLEAARSRMAAALPEKIFNDELDGLVIYLDRNEQLPDALKNVFIIDRREPRAPVWIFAREGLIVPSPHELTFLVHLKHGWIFSEDSGENSRRVVSFDDYDLKAEARQRARLLAVTPLEMSTSALRASIASARDAGSPDILLEIEMARRWTTPFAIFPFALLGITLGMSTIRGGRSERFAMALGLFFLYYLLMQAADALARANVLGSYFSAAFPDLAFSGAAVLPFFINAFNLDGRLVHFSPRPKHFGALSPKEQWDP